MHDPKSLSLTYAVLRHEGEAHEPARHFRELRLEEREALLIFLISL
jgi:CxxC motif-containing protein (DUF1111 family)